MRKGREKNVSYKETLSLLRPSNCFNICLSTSIKFKPLCNRSPSLLNRRILIQQLRQLTHLFKHQHQFRFLHMHSYLVKFVSIWFIYYLFLAKFREEDIKKASFRFTDLTINDGFWDRVSQSSADHVHVRQNIGTDSSEISIVVPVEYRMCWIPSFLRILWEFPEELDC